jgi:F0F1-type ATP synthase epsilon subunit
MADVTLTQPEEVVTPTEVSAHEAAVAEGATQVHQDRARDAAEKAEEAADLALSAAKHNIENAAEVADASEKAQGAAASASISAETVMEALHAQTSAIAALAERLDKPTQQAGPPAEASGRRPPADKTPKAPKRGSWYYGR